MEEEKSLSVRIQVPERPDNVAGPIIASFGCGLPASMQDGTCEPILLRSRKDKTRMLVCEDSKNGFLYYDCHVSPNLSTIVQPCQAIGVYNPKKGKLTLVKVKESFVMKQEKCHPNYVCFNENIYI